MIVPRVLRANYDHQPRTDAVPHYKSKEESPRDAGIEPEVGLTHQILANNIRLERSKPFQEGLRLTELDFAAG
jgi:hypothetical protein